MSEKRYVVRLTGEERERLDGLIGKGKGSAHKLLHARILLQADADRTGGGRRDAQIAEALETSVSTVQRVRRLFVEEGTEASLSRKKQERPSRQRVFDGEKEAHLIAIACSEPPAGRARWTLQLLAGALVERKIMDHVSGSSVCRTLKKTRLSPISTDNG